jgi:N utilization substance protein A
LIKLGSIMNSPDRNEEVREAFRKHVPEVAAGVVELVAIAREPESHVMVAVRSINNNIHPVSVCVGKAAERVKSITTELAGEKVYILLWSALVEDLIIHAMQPGRLGRSRTPKVTLDAETHQARVQVETETLDRMTARDGLLVRLASRLVGWDIKLFAYDNADC